MDIKKLQRYENTEFYFKKGDSDAYEFIAEILANSYLRSYFDQALEWNDFVVIRSMDSSQMIVDIGVNLDVVDSSSMKDYYVYDIQDTIYNALGLRKKAYDSYWAVEPAGNLIQFLSGAVINLD